MASSRPHPYGYQIASFHLEDKDLEINHPSIVQIPRDSPLTTNPVGHPQPQTLAPSAPSRHHEPFPFQRRPVFLLIFLPIAPLLSLLYMSTGHAILRQSQKSSSSIYHAPILSSAEAGATGGLILSLPIAFLLYVLVFPTQRSVPEDFFEDDDSLSAGSAARWMTYAGYVICIFFFFGIGGVAGPLGVTCLSSGTSNAFIITKKMLSTSAATAAGFLGGVVLSVGILLLGLMVFLVWIRRNKPSQ